VTVVDRQASAAAETSFANGGQISVSHAEPWANPSAPLKVLRWLMKEDAPLLFRLRADVRQWLWGLSFVYECTPHRTRRNIEQIVRLGAFSREKLRVLRAAEDLRYDELERGILHFYTSESEFRSALGPAQQMRELGCQRQVISPDAAVGIEPALAQARSKIVGATYTPSDESGDARAFTLGLQKVCTAAGVKFLFHHTITAIRQVAGSVEHVEVTDSDGLFSKHRADAYVLAAGSWSAPLAAPLGIRLNIYPAKGYSITMPVADPSKAYDVSLTDDEYKLVFSRLGDRLRIAGTAELNGYDRSLNPVRCEAIVRRVEELFPGAGDTSNVAAWAGLRPSTPSNVPYLGKSALPNLFLNTGHGTLGWTHSCGSGHAVADIVCGRRPELDFAFSDERPHSHVEWPSGLTGFLCQGQ
jgi:D-amino-acid dehydrogenase